MVDNKSGYEDEEHVEKDEKELEKEEDESEADEPGKYEPVSVVGKSSPRSKIGQGRSKAREKLAKAQRRARKD